MHKIGSGLQYNVYDLCHGRVLKRRTSKLQKSLFWLTRKRPDKIFKAVILGEEKAYSTISVIKRNLHRIDSEIIGNPKIYEDLSYEQDLAIPLGNIFKTHNLARTKKIIDAYIENIFDCWRNGFSDIVWNFTLNSGLNNRDRLILMDIGELTFSKKHVSKMIRDKTWLTQWAYSSLKNGPLKKYIGNELNTSITVENLIHYWNPSRINLSS